MIKPVILAACSAALLLTACSEASYDEGSAEYEVRSVPEVDYLDAEAAEEAVVASEIPVSIPQIAYIYEMGFRVAGGELAALQNKHVAMCEALGTQTCQIIEMSNSGGEGDYANGWLRMAVAADKARNFGAGLGEAAEIEGGEQISSSIAGEDLSKQIVDTEARLRARTVLRDRLMEILQTRRGTVAELVEAERGVAQVNEEIDQATSWLAEMRGRVDFSRMNVSYQSGTPSTGGFFAPIRSVFGSLGMIVGTVIAGLIALVAISLPIGLVVWGLLALRRRVRKPKPEV